MRSSSLIRLPRPICHHALRRLAEAGTAVLALHHPRKKPSDEGSAARGSGALLGFVDVILELHRYGTLASDECRRRIVGLSRHAETPRSAVYEWTPGTADFKAVGDPLTAQFKENWEAVKSILDGRHSSATHRQLLTDWPATRPRPSERQLYEWLSRAFAEGLAKRSGNGTRVSPYRWWVRKPDDLPELPELPPLRWG